VRSSFYVDFKEDVLLASTTRALILEFSKCAHIVRAFTGVVINRDVSMRPSLMIEFEDKVRKKTVRKMCYSLSSIDDRYPRMDYFDMRDPRSYVKRVDPN